MTAATRIEQVRVEMLRALDKETPERDTYADGYASGLIRAMQILDAYPWRSGSPRV